MSAHGPLRYVNASRRVSVSQIIDAYFLARPQLHCFSCIGQVQDLKMAAGERMMPPFQNDQPTKSDYDFVRGFFKESRFDLTSTIWAQDGGEIYGPSEIKLARHNTRRDGEPTAVERRMKCRDMVQWRCR
jgi:hypothetical protein